jgi:hypothetical protein
VSWEDRDGLERGGDCAECGEPVEQEHHVLCPDCYREQQGWRPRREERPAATSRPESFVVAIATLRRELAELRARVERLEGAA